ncbi:MAG: Crp/Fnr family transcriptional regulator [Rhodomicrobiaceae bacterium]
MAHAERVSLERRTYLTAPHDRPDYVYFMESGFASLVVTGPNGRKAEAGLIGKEGASGIPVILGNDQWPHETFIQHEGAALRVGSHSFRTAMERDEAIRRVMLSFVQVLLIQIAYTALANNFAKLEERLARWLLMSHDRIDGNQLPVVHEFMAEMLGVRRPGVTVALHILEGKGLIHAERGKLVIVDRDGLIEHAAGYYGAPEAEFARLMGQPASTRDATSLHAGRH